MAATNISGVQNGSVTWSVANSPYTVTGDVQVPAGSTLTIAAGVTVKFAGAYQIYVQGTLVANGTAGSPIVFGSTSAGTSSGATMLKFEGTNLSNSQLSYVQMSDAAKAIMVGGGGGEFNPGVACTGTLTVAQASITNAEVRTGGYGTSARLVLSQATVTNATIIGQYPRSEPIEVTGSTVSNSVINSDSYNAGITLTNTAVSGSQLLMGCCGANLTLSGGSVSNSTVTTTNSGDGPFTITGTTLTNTPVTLPGTPVTITGATFTFTSGATSPRLQFKSGTVTATTITGTGSGVGLEFGSGSGSVTVSGTTITDFATGLRFSGVRSSGTLTVHRLNTFQRNSAYNLENRTAVAVAATANYWGTTVASDVALKIYDSANDIMAGTVTTANFLTSPPSAPAVTVPPSSTTLVVGNTLALSVSVTGSPAPSFQWRKNGMPISGATASSFGLTGVTMADAGSYDVVVTNELGSSTSAAAALIVNKAPATVNLGALSQTYNGSPRSVTATTSPSGLTVILSYNGSVTAPTNAGSYTVVATINDANYTGSSVGTFVIGKATAVVTLGALSQTYSGTALGATAATSPSGLATALTYDGNTTMPVNVGSYTVVGTVNDVNYAGSATTTLNIAKASQNVSVGPLPATVNVGVPFTLSATASSGLTPVTFAVVLGNATVTGASAVIADASPVTFRASQAGNANINAASVDFIITSGKQTQTISFAALGDVSISAAPIALNASASSGLPVTFSLISGPAAISGSTLTLSGATGIVTVRASQAGNGAFNAAPDADRSFTVAEATTAPSITGQPSSKAATAGDTVAFTVTATGAPAPTYQWRKNGTAIGGATSATFSLGNVTINDAATYDVIVTNAAGTTTSAAATLTVSVPTTPPVITSHPANRTAVVGGSVTFSVTATGSPAPSFQWLKGGVAISGATATTLTLTNLKNSDAAAYSVIVTNPAGSATSSDATLTVSAGATFQLPTFFRAE